MIFGKTTIDGTLIKNLSYGSDKRIRVKCDNCKIVTTTRYYNYNLSQKKFKRNSETYCKVCSCKMVAKRRIGKPSPLKGIKLPPEKRGKNHPSWKGGQWLSSDGYMMIYTPVENPQFKWNNYTKRHIIVIEKKLGRKLIKDEVIHHIDGNKLNDDSSNLYICNPKEHKQKHTQLQELSYKLIQNNLLKFKNGKYILSNKLKVLCNVKI